MRTVVEIEKALQTLPVKDARKIADWLQEYLDGKCDKQIDGEITTGGLERLARTAMRDYHAGRIKSLDEIVDKP